MIFCSLSSSYLLIANLFSALLLLSAFITSSLSPPPSRCPQFCRFRGSFIHLAYILPYFIILTVICCGCSYHSQISRSDKRCLMSRPFWNFSFCTFQWTFGVLCKCSSSVQRDSRWTRSSTSGTIRSNKRCFTTLVKVTSLSGLYRYFLRNVLAMEFLRNPPVRPCLVFGCVILHCSHQRKLGLRISCQFS